VEGAGVDYLANLADSFGEQPDEPETTAEESEPEQPIPAFYRPLYEATEAVALGEIEVDQWMILWHQVGLSLERMAEQISSQVEQLGSSLGDEARLAGQLLLSGLEDALEALQVMGDYLDDQNPRHLQEGWGDLLEASFVIARATQEFQNLRSRIRPADL
jgi:outer membrane PBP1 activator LpoA protein